MEEKTMFYLVLYSLSMLLATSKCSERLERVYCRLIDMRMVNPCTSRNHSDYCNEIGACKPGTHIMCMYYRAGQTSGPACRNGRMIKLENATKNIIMKKINTIRTGMSSATVRGKNDVLLPKAKNGLAELEWDSELALLAQVWANQCEMLAEDTCRATKNFSNPGQIVAVTAFVMPKEEPSNKMCMKRSDLNRAIDTSFETWQQDMKHVTSEDIQKYKDKEIDGEDRRNNFLTLVNGRTTHVGCGLSAYKAYGFTGNEYEKIYIELVCNLSSQPIEEEPVYDYELVTATETTATTETTEKSAEVTTDNTKETTEQPTSPLTTLPTDPPDHTTSHTSHGPKNGDNNEEGYGNGNNRRPTVLILPIITVEDAPGDKYLQKLSLINENLRGYSKKVLSSKNVLHNMNKQEIQKPRTSKKENSKKVLSSKIALHNMNKQAIQRPRTLNKSSIFTRVPTFHLPSQNNDSRHKDNMQENVLLRNKLKVLLEKVPRKDLSRLEEALKILKRKRGRRVHQLSTISPLLNSNVHNEVNLTNTEVPKIQNVDIKLKYKAPGIDGTDDDLLSVARGVLKTEETDYGKETRLIYGDKTKYPKHIYWSRRNKVPDNSIRNAEKSDKWTANTGIGNKKDINRAIETQSQFDSIPTIRKQIPIVHAKENNVFDEKYSKFHNHFDRHTNYKSLNNFMKDTNVKEQIGKLVDGSKIVLDESKSKRRMYLENEIYKLRKKLQHLRQYIRRNDISENDRFRPVVEPHNNRLNIKLKDVDNFYMPDRAHSIHEF